MTATHTPPLAEFLEESCLTGITDESLDAMMSDTAYWAEFDTACDTFDRIEAVSEFNAQHEATTSDLLRECQEFSEANRIYEYLQLHDWEEYYHVVRS